MAISLSPAISLSQSVETNSSVEYDLGDGLNTDLIKDQKRREAQKIRDICTESLENIVKCGLANSEMKLGAFFGAAKHQDNLGNFYYFGVFNKRPNPEKALKWIYRAALQNSNTAQFKMYVFYSDDELQAASIDKPRIHWLTESAKGGYAYAQYALGYNLYKGNLIEKDVEQGIRWMLKASAAGNVFAKQKISSIYLSSLDTLKQYKISDDKGKRKSGLICLTLQKSSPTLLDSQN